MKVSSQGLPRAKSRGKVYLVGAGPGDPDLITVRGKDLVSQADVIVVDDLVNPLLLLNNPTAKIIYVGKRGPGSPQGAFLKLPQKGINRLLVSLALKNRKVVRLKGGDPVIFGRGGEEMEALHQAKIPYEIVPGVTSAVAGPAYAGIPLSDRRWASTITFMTGQESDHAAPGIDWEKLSAHGTLVILMGVARWKSIQTRLLSLGWPKKKPVAAIQSAACRDQKIYLTTLTDSQRFFKSKKLVSPAILVVGDVSNLSRRLSWIEKEKPLLGKTIVVTRPALQRCGLNRLLVEKGAFVVSCPAIAIEPVMGDSYTTSLISKIKNGSLSYDWIIFLSQNGVQSFRSLMGSGEDWRRDTKIFSIGSHTKESVERAGWPVYRMAVEFNSNGVLKSIGSIKGKKILVPRVQDGPKEFIQELRRRGALVDEISTYRTVPALPPHARLKEVLLKGVDFVTFTSGSTVENFLGFFSPKEIQKIFSKACALSIGPVTTLALRRKGIKKIVQAKTSTAEGMVHEIS